MAQFPYSAALCDCGQRRAPRFFQHAGGGLRCPVLRRTRIPILSEILDQVRCDVTDMATDAVRRQAIRADLLELCRLDSTALVFKSR